MFIEIILKREKIWRCWLISFEYYKLHALSMWLIAPCYSRSNCMPWSSRQRHKGFLGSCVCPQDRISRMDPQSAAGTIRSASPTMLVIDARICSVLPCGLVRVKLVEEAIQPRPVAGFKRGRPGLNCFFYKFYANKAAWQYGAEARHRVSYRASCPACTLSAGSPLS